MRELLSCALGSALAVAVIVVTFPQQSPSSPWKSVPCTRFAAPGGGDSQSGTKQRPFATAQRLVASLRPGDTGCLRSGTYNQRSPAGYVLYVEHGGAPGAPITLRSFPGERAKLIGIVVVPKGSDNVVLDDLDIEGSGVFITVKIYSADVTVEDSDITNAGRGSSCLTLGNNLGDGQAVRPVIRRNRIHDCGSNAIDYNHQHGIYSSNATQGQIVGNIIWSVAAKAIQLYPNAQGMRVSHNIVDGGQPSIRGGIIIGGNSNYSSSDNIVEHNVIVYARTYNVYSRWEGKIGVGNIVRYNCFWGGATDNIGPQIGFTATENVIAVPLFINRKQRDYRLRQQSRCTAVFGQG